ncbi:hypothetical protein MIND_00133500 [Mycena indigotica]|uniref:Arrestin-like N-terminal domain-containing protein n=1 Tax=Mycena indigotica TaxID=2126181 RepID=A0A8H6TCP1_9AGAR|nr:uncharacterized protein MIND_00133500 [Mycena indigotica]KAF7316153.1 hypothetical protein MIND_00133500 [Mycena indigotica]
MSAPPVYDAEGHYSQASTTSLPAYQRHDSANAAITSTQHTFTLNDSKTKIRASLSLTSNATAPESLPVFLEGNIVSGSLAGNIPWGQKVTRIVVLVRGEIWLGGPANDVNRSPHLQSDKLRFLNIVVTLWERAHGAELIQGEFKWPFSIPLPKEVLLNDPGEPKVQRKYSLPQTFLERGSPVTLHYSIMARIVYKNMFRDVDAEIKTMFVYVPAIRPDPPSRLRQLAYRSNSSIPGPEIDPAGWYLCMPIVVQGIVFNARPIQLQCLLALAEPLCYTRGGFIPCLLTYNCADKQALDLLATPSAISICLQRRMTCAPFRTSSGHYPLAANDVHECARATWSLAAPNYQRRDTRVFEGEIAVPKTLKPTSALAQFTLDYYVVLQPPRATGFASTGVSGPLLSQEVKIATIFPRGTRPRSNAPTSII